MPPLDATFPPVAEPPVALVAGRWRVEGPIGRGAFGSVWRGVDTGTGAHVAVKFLEPGTSLDLARVRKEVAALRLLRVPGVVELLDAGTQDGRHYLVMELVEGLPFPGRAHGWAAIAPLVARLCETLRQIHARGVVHRDLKPSNVLVTEDGRVVVLDFGVARGAA
ncbi:MAG: serine/threonine-protein kinase, partial [Myxococcota bacterium]